VERESSVDCNKQRRGPIFSIGSGLPTSQLFAIQLLLLFSVFRRGGGEEIKNNGYQPQSTRVELEGPERNQDNRCLLG
jgi:hypothetical protein